MKREIINDPHFAILDESPDFIVVNKPAPLLVHPSVPGNPPTLLCGLQALLAYEVVNGSTLSIINRLDRETSGVVLIAKNKKAARRFGHAMEQRQMHKEYQAIVTGWPAQDSYLVTAPLRRLGEFSESKIWLKQAIHPDGRPCQTTITVERRFQKGSNDSARFALVRAIPQTGRPHQIRVHLASLGFPVVGDKIYGPDEQYYLDHIETGWTPEMERALHLPRHALHCSCMIAPALDGDQFPEGDNRELRWDAPLARDLEHFLSGDAENG